MDAYGIVCMIPRIILIGHSSIPYWAPGSRTKVQSTVRGKALREVLPLHEASARDQVGVLVVFVYGASLEQERIALKLGAGFRIDCLRMG